jgi:hypothetical protein
LLPALTTTGEPVELIIGNTANTFIGDAMLAYWGECGLDAQCDATIIGDLVYTVSASLGKLGSSGGGMCFRSLSRRPSRKSCAIQHDVRIKTHASNQIGQTRVG